MQTFPVGAKPRLILDVNSALLEFTVHDSPTLKVEVGPARPGRNADLKAAERVQVQADLDTISITTPGLGFVGFGGVGTARIQVLLPANCDVDAKTGNGTVSAAGALGRARLRTSNGSIRVDAAQELRANTANGTVTVGRVDGDAELSSSNGTIEVGSVLGNAALKTSNGDIRVDRVAGRTNAKTAAGSILLGTCSNEAVLKTSAGGISIRRVEGGSIQASTSVGEISADVAPGVAVWVDANSKSGAVINDLSATDGPASDRTAELRLSTSLGTIRLRRLPGEATAAA